MTNIATPMERGCRYDGVLSSVIVAMMVRIRNMVPNASKVKAWPALVKVVS